LLPRNSLILPRAAADSLLGRPKVEWYWVANSEKRRASSSETAMLPLVWYATSTRCPCSTSRIKVPPPEAHTQPSSTSKDDGAEQIHHANLARKGGYFPQIGGLLGCIRSLYFGACQDTSLREKIVCPGVGSKSNPTERCDFDVSFVLKGRLEVESDEGLW